LVSRAFDLARITTATYKPVKILNALEVEEKMELGLCFLCDEPFTLEHQLLHKNIKIVTMDDEDDVEPEECQEEVHQLQLNNPVAFPITFPPKSLSSNDSVSFICDSLVADKDDSAEQSHVEDNTVTDSVSTMKSTDNNSSFLSDGNAIPTMPLQVFDQMPMKRLKSTSMNQRQPIMRAFTQNHSSPFNPHHLSEV
jgi:hypothetical protein